jgi:hypothetical protein
MEVHNGTEADLLVNLWKSHEGSTAGGQNPFPVKFGINLLNNTKEILGWLISFINGRVKTLESNSFPV